MTAAKGVLANDSDPDDLSLTAVRQSGPSNGSLTLNADGSFSYTPGAGFTGQDSFTYVARDPSGQSSSPVTVTLLAKPVAFADSYSLAHDRPVTISADEGVLANDQNAAGGTLTANFVSGSGPSHGSLTLNSDGSFTYAPAAGYTGPDSFQYYASANGLSSAAVTVTLTVFNNAPAASPDNYDVAENRWCLRAIARRRKL